MHVVVVGGGLAGLAAALDLVDRGARVTLLEARPTLGGAVQTLPERSGDPSPPPDNGQHIALGCCSEYLRFLGRVGQASAARRVRLRLPVLDELGRVATITPGLGLLSYGHLTISDRLRVAGTIARLARLRPERHDGETFGGVLRRLGSTDAAIDRFWDVFIRPALNVPADEASAALGLFTVKTALLAGRSASDLVLPAEPLGEMHGAAAARALEAGGADVRVRTRAAALDDGAVVTESGERLGADGVVVALPPAQAAELLGEPEPQLGASPIVSVHLLFGRRLLAPPLAALLDSPAHWIFDRGRLTGHEPEHGQYLTVVSSGAPELLAVRGRELVELMRTAITQRLGEAELLWSRVSREPEATFYGGPGQAAARPPLETARPDVVRAGAWTRGGWPATMEGAIRSGRAAARALLRRSAEAAARAR